MYAGDSCGCYVVVTSVITRSLSVSHEFLSAFVCGWCLPRQSEVGVPSVTRTKENRTFSLNLFVSVCWPLKAGFFQVTIT